MSMAIEGTYKLWYAPIKEHYIAVKINELQIHKTIWMIPGVIFLILNNWYDVSLNKLPLTDQR